jgi:hypothetical protein
VKYVLFAAVAALMTLPVRDAQAQEQNKFAIGVSWMQRAVEDAPGFSKGLGIDWRIGHSKDGWGWHYGLGWYATDLNRDIGGRTVPFGELRVRPFMGGYGYTKLIGRKTSITGDVIGGLAFTSFNLSAAATNAYQGPGGGPGASVQIGAAPVVKPEVDVWYDLSRRVGVSVNAGYLVVRPRITIDSPLGHESSRLRADAFTVTVGLVYSIL